MNYEQKYIKYKKKYFDLKLNLKGGNNSYQTNVNPINILLVTHNARMRCFLDSLKNDKNNPVNIMGDKLKLYNDGKQKKEKEIRFMNGAVLKLSIPKASFTGTISLFYSGQVNNRREGLYFVNTSNPADPNYQTNTEFGTHTFDLYKSFGISPLPVDVDFYIVRHGEGTHNLPSYFKKIKFVANLGKDTSLTSDGEKQALSTGQNFLNSNIKFNTVFVSKMERTKQTAYLILKNSENLQIKKFIVLPCSHELLYKESKNCDEANAYIPRSPENISNCESGDKTLTTCTPTCCNFVMKYAEGSTNQEDSTITIDWSEYNDFYYTNKKECRNTNMIKESIEYLRKNNII